MRLVGRRSRCAGKLRVEHDQEWRPVSYRHSWSLREAAVLCRQLGCGSAVYTGTVPVSSSAQPQPVWRFYSSCDGSEQALMSCGAVREWLSPSTVEVVCSGKNAGIKF